MSHSSPTRLAVAVALLLAGVPSAMAQEAYPPGQARAQLRPVGEPEAPTDSGPFEQAPIFVDYREEMRRFVQSISAYARKQKKNFAIVAQNGLDLLNKIEGLEESKPRPAPARAYMHAIDGILVENLHYGFQQFDRPMPPNRHKKALGLVTQARQAGLRVLTVDYALDSLHVEDAYRRSLNDGYVPFVAPARGFDLSFLPRHPARPVNENPEHILSLREVRNFAWLMDSSPFGTEAQFALKMHETNFDLLLVGITHGRDILSRRAVETLKYKYLGSRRQVFAHVNIGTAAAYDYFWKPEWREGSPTFIGTPVKGNPDLYRVEYWKPEWQQIITGNTNSMIQGVIYLGFDGVVLDGLDAFQYFERPEGKKEDTGEDIEDAEAQATPSSAPAEPAAPAPATTAPEPAPEKPAETKPAGPLMLSPAAGLPSR
jgi:cysteinyl-tRNA synthetase